MKRKNKNKIKVVYKEDNGETIYSMAGLYGKTPEEVEELANKKQLKTTKKERWAMIRAAFTVYGPVLLILITVFSLVAVLMYLCLVL